MNEENKNIKHGLENLNTYEPKPDLWDSIEAGLEDDSKPKIIYWRWLSGIAAMIVISLTLNWFAKNNIDTPVVETTETVKIEPNETVDSADSQVLEINMPVPEQMKTGNTEVPSTGPNDGKAGEALHTQNYRDKAVVEERSSGSTNTTAGIASNDVLAPSPVTYNWSFGDSVVQGNGKLPTLYFNPSLAESIFTYDANSIQTDNQTSYSFSNSSTIAEGSFTLATSDVKTDYEESDNIGYSDADGIAAVVTNDDVEQFGFTQGEIGSNPDERGIDLDRSIENPNSNDINVLKSSQTTPPPAPGVGLPRNLYVDPNIKTPFVRVIEKEKYQCEIKDSVHFTNNSLFYHDSKYYEEPTNTESYFPLIENEYLKPTQEPLSTFGIDVDNASYAVMRTKITSNQIVPKDAVRIEEFINYFDYNYPEPTDDAPFTINLENADCPWNTNHQLVRIGLKGKDINYNEMQHSNLVFLIDVSGSMDSENKLPLVKKSMKLLVDQMGPHDRIAIVTYAGAAGLALESTKCDEKEYIKKKIDKLDAGGSTAGGEGIKLAYNIALENLIADGNNRVIMCTDGDFNVGQNSDSDMKQLIINNRNKGIFITACGFGMGNYQDSKMETIADNGNGNYLYIDTYRESEKVFNREIRATLFTIAKDVKIQVEFNPKHVKAYRLIGYENRKMPPQDFNDDTKDGGELGAGHTVTALYEIIPTTSDEAVPGGIDLKYQTPATNTTNDYGDELLTVKLRYKKPNGTTSMLLEKTINAGTKSFNEASEDLQFASGVALYAQQLRQSKFIDQKDFTLAAQLVEQSLGTDINGDRQELLTLIKKASKNYQVYTKE